jgi:tetratricopeptide (TPR) repeat protein
MSSTSPHRRRLLAILSLALCVLLLVPVAEANKKNKKKKKKRNSEKAAVSQVEEAPAIRSKPSPAVARAFRHLNAFETEAARESLASVTDDNAWSATAKAMVLEQDQDYATATLQLRQAADRFASEPAPAYYLGETLLHANDMGTANDAFARAESRARAILESAPGDSEALYYLGSSLQRQRRFDEAIIALEQAKAAAPDDAMVDYQIGVTKAFQEKWQEAYDALTKALDKNSGIAYAYYYRGRAAGRLGRKDLMVNDLDRFLAMAPNAPEADNARKVRGAA